VNITISRKKPADWGSTGGKKRNQLGKWNTNKGQNFGRRISLNEGGGGAVSPAWLHDSPRKRKKKKKSRTAGRGRRNCAKLQVGASISKKYPEKICAIN